MSTFALDNGPVDGRPDRRVCATQVIADSRRSAAGLSGAANRSGIIVVALHGGCVMLWCNREGKQVATITEWLASLGMSEYAQRFAENRIDDVGVLRHLTDQDLKDIGVPLGHRRKMLAAAAELPGAASVTSQAAATPGRKPLDDAERRQLTVMFCDLVGSTALSARLDPEDLRGVIGAYHRCCTEVIERYGGFVAKYMGDGVLLYFGYPHAHEYDAERAVRAGLALVEAVPKLATEAGMPLQARVGIATGLVVVGDLIGAGAAQEQAVVGETPNLAARLQGIAEPNTVIIADSTRRLLGTLFELQDLGARELKGIAAPVRHWAALRPSLVESRFEALHAGGLTELVGREEELELLLRRWSKAKTGEGQLVLLSGEAGIGKSRLTAALLERLAGEPHTRLRYFCSPQHTDSALYPIIGQMERAAGLTHDDALRAKLDKLDAVLAQTSTSIEDASLFAEMMSLPNDGRYPTLDELTPQQRRQRTLEALISPLEALARQSPVLMIFDDAHWTDPTSLEVFSRVVDRIETLRALLIVTFRPEFDPPWIGQSHATAMTINRLTKHEVGAMIDGVVGDKLLPASIRQDIIERTDGVPLFVEEMTKAVLEAESEGAAQRTVAAAPSSVLAIPASLHASLMARLDRLGPAKEVAQFGAAIGRAFSYTLLTAVARKPEGELASALDRLMVAGLLFRQGVPPDATYLFKHVLVQDAAYGTLLRSRRQQLHARIAMTLEDQFPEIVVSQPALLAQHCAEAGLAEKAVSYWLKAGLQAFARSAITEAVTQLQKGLDMLDRLPDGPSRRRQELDLQMALRPALAATKGPSAPDVGESLARGRVLAEQLDRPDCLVPLLHGQWAFHLVRSEYGLALSLARQMENIGETRNDVAAAHLAQGFTLFFLGDVTTARTHLEQSHELGDAARRAGYSDIDPLVVNLAILAMTLMYLGYIDLGRARMNEAVSEARRLDHAHTLAWMLNWMCEAAWALSLPQEAYQSSAELLSLSSQHGFSFWLAEGSLYRGWSMAALGNAREGLAMLTKGLSIRRAAGAEISTPQALMLFDEVYAQLGQPVEQLNCLAEAGEIIERTQERYNETELHRLRGDLLKTNGDQAAAEQSYDQALEVAKRQGAKLWELRAATSLACLWRDQGKRTEARDLLAPVYGWFTEGFDTPVLKDAKSLLDELT